MRSLRPPSHFFLASRVRENKKTPSHEKGRCGSDGNRQRHGAGSGLAGALGAAVCGLTDWQDIDPPARRIGLAHGVLNVASVALFGSSRVARRRGARERGRGLAALGYAVSVAAARLGGNLIYGQKIGVDHSNAEKLPAEFTPVLAESELPPGQSVRAEHNGTPILLVRRGQQTYALAETCAHLGGPLSEGKLEGDVIQCPWHASRFSVRDGARD